MTEQKRRNIERLISRIPTLTVGQIYWLDKVVEVFESPSEFKVLDSDLYDESTLENFGDALRIHHCFSAEPFSKDKFEYVLEQVLRMSGQQATLAAKGNRGHDIIVNDCPISLKTQADKGIKKDTIWISKFMELGRGEWGSDPNDLVRLREMFLAHMTGYKRILMLRALERGPQWHYELLEIPLQVLKLAAEGELEMKMASRQYPKPGYCYVRESDGTDIFQLYFDGGSERKLQIKNLKKAYCKVHASWGVYGILCKRPFHVV